MYISVGILYFYIYIDKVCYEIEALLLPCSLILFLIVILNNENHFNDFIAKCRFYFFKCAIMKLCTCMIHFMLLMIDVVNDMLNGGNNERVVVKVCKYFKHVG